MLTHWRPLTAKMNASVGECMRVTKVAPVWKTAYPSRELCASPSLRMYWTELKRPLGAKSPPHF